MYNPYYSYEDCNLWREDEWAHKYCSVFPLYRAIEYLNFEKFHHPAGSGPFTERTDGVYSAKTMAVVYEDVAKSVEDLGMSLRVYSMGMVNWVPVVPKAGVKRGGREIPVLMVQQSVDYADRNWAMDIIARYREMICQAAKEDWAICFVCTEKPDVDNLFSSILMEFGALYRADFLNLYLDVSRMREAGKKLGDVSDFTYFSEDGKDILDPDEMTEQWGNISALNITDRWQNRVSNLWGTATAVRSVGKGYDLERHIHSWCGKTMAYHMRLEHDYDDAEDPRLLAYWDSIGLVYTTHEMQGQRWVSMVPKCALGQTEEKLPVMMIFREVYKNNGHLPLIAISGFHDYTELAAQGEMILLFFAMEDPDDNDLFYDILQEAAVRYPIDLSRVYVTGHSHNGMYAFEFARRHWKSVAAAALQGQRFGLMAPSYSGSPIAVPDEHIEQLSHIDLPVIAINGQAENIMTKFDTGSRNYRNSVDAYQRRLRAFHCPPKTAEEIEASLSSSDYATRRLGIPADWTEVQVIYGREVYIGHVRNTDGKEYFRACTVDNLPHITTPMTPFLSWNFVRRFARDLKTGAIIERY